MDLVLTELLHCARAYIDDVVIFSTTWDDHKQHLKAVLGCLWEVGLTSVSGPMPLAHTWARSLAEEEFIQRELCKVSAVQDFRRHITKSDVRSYLGLTGYYRRFVSQYAEDTAALTTVTRETAPVKVEWTTALEDEFQYLKHSLSHISSLTIPT